MRGGGSNGKAEGGRPKAVGGKSRTRRASTTRNLCHPERQSDTSVQFFLAPEKACQWRMHGVDRTIIVLGGVLRRRCTPLRMTELGGGAPARIRALPLSAFRLQRYRLASQPSAIRSAMRRATVWMRPSALSRRSTTRFGALLRARGHRGRFQVARSGDRSRVTEMRPGSRARRSDTARWAAGGARLAGGARRRSCAGAPRSAPAPAAAPQATSVGRRRARCPFFTVALPVFPLERRDGGILRDNTIPCEEMTNDPLTESRERNGSGTPRAGSCGQQA